MLQTYYQSFRSVSEESSRLASSPLSRALGGSSQTFSVSTDIHRLDLGPLLTGMALSSVRMHKYSPITAVRAMQATLTSHQDRAAGG